MSEGLSVGMFVAGALLSAIPIVLFIAGAVYLYRRYLEERPRAVTNQSKEAGG